jgi:hypothetical protein
VHRLQRLRDDHVFERSVLKSRKAALDVHLNHVNAVADAPQNAFAVDFDTVARDVPGFAQVAQQPAVATAEIEDTFARRNPVGDHRKVEAFALLGPGSPIVLGHVAMFSR